MEQQRLDYLRFNRTVSALDAVLANDGDRAGRRMLNFMHIVIVMRAVQRDEYMLL